MNKTIAIDEDGYFKSPDGVRLVDEDVCRSWLETLAVNAYGVCSITVKDENILVEAFDKPLVVQQVEITEDKVQILMPYGYRQRLELSSLCLDSQDRFHGLSEKGVPFVFTRKAQAEFFSGLEAFSDDTVTLLGQTYATKDFFVETPTIETTAFWSKRYNPELLPPWDLDKHHPALESILPQLKLLKGRFWVPGCGRGHDAHFLSQKGHIVEGTDFSAEAIQQARQLYPESPNLRFSEGDVLSWAGHKKKSYDYIFEHTCFCAIPPAKRNDMVKTWFQTLDDGGHLLALFFVHTKRGGPPFGSSEWELRNLLEPYFDFRYWTRSQVSPENRRGVELIVYAEKKKHR